MTVRDDILPSELTIDDPIVTEASDRIITQALPVVYRSTEGDRGRMRQPRPALDIDGFYELVKKAIDDQELSEEKTTDEKIIFTEESPETDIELETITYSLNSRTPATMSGPPMEGKRTEFKPFIRSVEDDPDNPGFRLITLGQQFENEVVFTCWAQTNKQANYRAMWFEDLMRRYAWMIKYSGVGEFFFMRRLSDTVVDITGKGNMLHARPLVYYVRTERLTHLSEPTIRRIIVRYGIGAINQ